MTYRNVADAYRKRAEELELKAAQIEAFGSNLDYEEDTTLLFRRTFNGSLAYTYAAVKAGNGYWYITGLGSRKWTWELLVEEHLINALEETGEVWIVSEWTRFAEFA